MLNVRSLNQYYGESHTLWNLDISVPTGQCTVIMGRNGVGKTTLLECIMGLQANQQGSILYKSIDLIKKKAEQRAFLGIGYIPQGRQIFSTLTVKENLEIGLPTRPDKSRIIPDSVFTLFPVLKEMLSRRGGDLSGGQQQQLAIARALATDPQLLILDEPTEGIQPNIVQEIGDIIQRLNQDSGLTVLLVEQKLPFARKVGDRFCILDKGRNVATGVMDELSEELIKQYLTV